MALDIELKDKALFIKRLKIALALKDMSRQQISDKVGTSVLSLNNVFSGKAISSTRMNALRRATGLSEIDFIMLAPGDDNV